MPKCRMMYFMRIHHPRLVNRKRGMNTQPITQELRLALLISGGGTTAQSIVEAIREGRLRGVTPALVIASTHTAAGIERLKKHGMDPRDVVVIEPKKYADQEAFGEALINTCKERGVNFLGQYGWLVKTPENVITAFPGMMTNQHPGPLDPGRPDFGGHGMYGMRVHCARLLFVRRTGRDMMTEATCQRVAASYDQGAVLKRRSIAVLPDDTPESLAERLLPVEHEVQIETLADIVACAERELVRAEPLVRPEEERILQEAKAEAIKRYPRG